MRHLLKAEERTPHCLTVGRVAGHQFEQFARPLPQPDKLFKDSKHRVRKTTTHSANNVEKENRETQCTDHKDARRKLNTPVPETFWNIFLTASNSCLWETINFSCNRQTGLVSPIACRGETSLQRKALWVSTEEVGPDVYSNERTDKRTPTKAGK